MKVGSEAVGDLIATNLDDGRLFSNVRIPAALHDAYSKSERVKRRQVLVVGLSLGMILFPGFVAFDAVLMPDLLLVSALMRFGIALPLAAILLIAIYRNALSLRVTEFAVCGLMWIVAAIVCYLVSHSGSASSGMIVSAMGVNVIMMFLTVIFQPPVRHTLVTIVLILALLATSMMLAPRITFDIWIGIMSLALATAIPALYAGWHIGNERKRQFMSLARDKVLMDQLSQHNDLLHKLSKSDPLTGLPNRRAFDATLVEIAEEARVSGDVVAVAMIDVDFFKRYNDHYGHVAGDDCLRSVANALTEAAGAKDRTARFGGEEFAVILTTRDACLLPLAGEGIRASIERLGLPQEGLGPGARVTISIGIEYIELASSGVALDLPSLIRKADAALYEAKRAGRNRVHVGRSGDAAADQHMAFAAWTAQTAA